MTRKLRKIAALVLSFAMLVSCFALNAFAEDTSTGNEAMNVGLALSAETAEPGTEVTVTVSISNNYNAATMRWPVLYSTDMFELVENSLVANIDGVTSVAGSTTTTTNEEFIPAAYAEDYSAFTIQWIANSDGTTIGAFNSATPVACFSFRLKVREDVSGKGTVLIPETSEHFYKMAVSDTADATSFYTAPVTFTVSDAATLEIKSAYVAPKLVALGDTIIDKANGFIYGLPFDGSLTEDMAGCLKVEGEGEIVTTWADGADGFGTGAKVELYDVNNAVVETYFIVIFGDSDGNGYVDDFDMNDPSDYLMFNEYIYEYSDLTLANAFAMDINADGGVDDFDIAIIEDYVMFNTDGIPQSYEA